jgi:hypothetical protein
MTTEKNFNLAVESHDQYCAPFTDLMDNPSGGLFHKGGPLWNRWDDVGPERYHNNGKAEDVYPQINRTQIDHIEGVNVWIGPQFNHFGHAVADAATRYLASSRVKNVSRYIVGDKTANSVGVLNRTVDSILQWFDIDTSKIIVANRALHFDTLVTFPQAEQRTGIGPSDEYLNNLSEHQFNKMHKKEYFDYGENVFVSRSRLKAHLAGEAFLERALQGFGFRTVFPELLPLEEQLYIYASASRLVFSEGSALHALTLLGNLNSAVTVVVRRPNFESCKHLVEPRVKQLQYLDPGVRLIHGSNRNGQPAPATGLAIPTFEGFTKCVATIKGESVQLNYKEFSESVESDIEDWLFFESQQERFLHPNYKPILLNTMKLAGVSNQRLK